MAICSAKFANGQPCERPVMEGRDVCAGHAGIARELERLVEATAAYLEEVGVADADDREPLLAVVSELATSKPRVAVLRRLANNLQLAAVR